MVRWKRFDYPLLDKNVCAGGVWGYCSRACTRMYIWFCEQNYSIEYLLKKIKKKKIIIKNNNK